jgi:serine/threonine protein kinase
MPPSVTHDIPLGTILRDTYEIAGVLGRGGMGTVFLANHLRLPGRQVAIKVLKKDAGLGRDVLVRFRREAEIASRLGHPNIIEVLDFDNLKDGSPFLVMECLRGQPLSRRLRKGPLTLEEVLSIARQMGSALQAAHRAGIVHRDLKPGNVFLSPTEVGGVLMEHVKLLDFGISKIIDSQSIHTQGGILLGTPQYMAPEQAQGKNQEVDPRTDIFSFGCMVYEMLARRLPFKDGPLPELIYRIVYDPPTPLDSLVSGVPEHVARAIYKAMEKRPEDRYPDVGAFILDLTGVALQSLPVVGTLPAMSVRPSQIETVGQRGQGKEVSVTSKAETVSYRRGLVEPGAEERSAKRPVVNLELHEVSTLSEDGRTPAEDVPPRPEEVPAVLRSPEPAEQGKATQLVRGNVGVAQGTPGFLAPRRARRRWVMAAAAVVVIGAVGLAVGPRLASAPAVPVASQTQGPGLEGVPVAPAAPQTGEGSAVAQAGTPEPRPGIPEPQPGTPEPRPGTALAQGPQGAPSDAPSASNPAEAKPSGTAQAQQPGTAQAQQPGTAQAQQSGTVQAQQSGTVQAQQSGTVQAQPPGTSQPQPPGTSQAQPPGTAVARRPGTSGTEPTSSGAPPQPTPPAGKTSGRKGAAASIPPEALADLVAGEKALSRGDTDEAVHLARRSQRVQVTGTSFSLLTRAHCQQKDLANALTTWERVPAWERTKVRSYCKQYDIAL